MKVPVFSCRSFTINKNEEALIMEVPLLSGLKKQVLMEECIRLKGDPIVKEPHIGIRQFWGLHQ
jgi:hypothetical protein